MNFSNSLFNWIIFNHRITAELEESGHSIDIVKVPLNNPSMASLVVENAQNNMESTSTLLLIPDPLQSYWMPSFEGNVDKLPHSFQWLLKVLSCLCETKEYEIWSDYLKMEKKYRQK